MKIWICGAVGMLGSHFTRLLENKKIPFIGTTRKELNIIDLEQTIDFVRVNKISHIINCAGYTHVDRAENEQKEAYLVNAVGPHHLGIAGRRHGARVMHFSTDYVFDGKQRSGYSEEDCCSPMSAYGMTKLAGEIKLLDEHRQACIIRTSWLFGYPGKNFIETILNLMKEKDELKVVSDQAGKPTYCQDLAEISLQLLNAEGIFHFANSFETTWYNFAKEIHKQASDQGLQFKTKNIIPITTLDYPTPAKRPSYSVLNTKKIENFLGIAPRSWQEALNDYLRMHVCSKEF